MLLLALLLVPVLVGLGGLVLGKGLITKKEFLVQEAVVVVLIGIGYLIALHAQTADTEIWNGVIAKKWRGTGSCCHSYPCNPHPCGCDKDGRNCSTCYDTCYEHSSDVTWNAVTSNGETAFSDTCNRPGSSPPARWSAITVGEPSAIEHGYVNYIKGNPDTILRRTGAAEKFKGKVPEYPRVYDHYRANRFIAAGAAVADLGRLNARLSEINGRLGPARQVNVIVIVTDVGDPAYVEGLRESWLGGKKNDLVVAVGVPSSGAIAWAGVVSWTKNEEVKIAIRDRLITMPSFDGDAVLDVVDEEVRTKFVRRPMADFEYLSATLEPPTWACWLIFVLGTLLSLGLSIYFWREDPFGGGPSRYGFGRSAFRRPW